MEKKPSTISLCPDTDTTLFKVFETDLNQKSFARVVKLSLQNKFFGKIIKNGINRRINTDTVSIAKWSDNSRLKGVVTPFYEIDELFPKGFIEPNGKYLIKVKF